MSDARKKPDLSIIVAVLAVAMVLVPFAFYFGGYIAMTTQVIDVIHIDEQYMAIGNETIRLRVYDARWKKSLYHPAAGVETWLTGRRVRAIPNDLEPLDDF